MRPKVELGEIEKKDIAAAIGRHPSTISRLFSKDSKQARGTSLETWKKIAEYLHISLDELYELVS